MLLIWYNHSSSLALLHCGTLTRLTTGCSVRWKDTGHEPGKPNEDWRRLGALSVYSDQWSPLFKKKKKKTFFVLWGITSFSFTVKTKHAAYLVYAVRVTLEDRRKLTQMKTPSSLSRSQPPGGDDNECIMHVIVIHLHLLLLLFALLLFPALSLTPSYTEDTEVVADACCSYKALRSRDWKNKMASSSDVRVWYQLEKSNRCFSFCPLFIGGVYVGDTQPHQAAMLDLNSPVWQQILWYWILHSHITLAK